jgi:hypothetical protein
MGAVRDVDDARFDHRDVRTLMNDYIGGWQRAVRHKDILFVSSPKMITGANCHHATRGTRDHPYLGRQLSDGEIWTTHGGVNPCGLVVRRGDRELRT